MASSDGTLTFSTKLDTSGVQSGLNDIKSSTTSSFTQIKNIVAALGIDKIVSEIFNTIKESISSAFDRIDTIDQFTRVITAMSGSAEEAANMLENINEIVTGTGYSLDTAASAAQKFVTSGLDLDSATKQVETWANAVAFYGDGTSETFENVTDAITKMVAKGSVEMDQLNRLTDAGIPAVQIYADSVGRSVSEVQNDLSDGVISTTEFLNGLTTAFEEGTTKFASIDNAAQESGTSWSSTFENAQTAVTRGVQGIIESLDEMLENNDLPSMREIIKEFGTKAEEFLDGVAEAISKVDLKSILETLKEFSPIIVAIVASFATFSTISSIISGVTAAMGLLNVVMAANPIVLIVSAIAGLVAAFIYLWNTSDEFRNFWIGLWDTIKEAFSSVGDFFSGIVDSIVTFFTETIPNAISGFVDTIVTFFTVTIPETLSNFVTTVVSFFEQIPYYIGYFIGLILGYFINLYTWIYNFYTVEIPAFISSVIEWFASLPEKIGEFISNIWEKIKEWGNNLVEFVTVDIPNFINNVVTWFSELPGKIWDWLSGVVTKITTWISDMKTKVSEKIPEIIDKIVGFFEEIPSKLLDVGKNMIEGLWDGINGAKDWISDKVSDFASGVVDGIKSVLGIASPSKVMRDEVGKWIPEGLAVGIDDNLDSISKAVDDMDSELVDKMKKAVALETGNVNANARLSSSVANNSVIQINATFDGNVEMDKNKVGRLVTPVVTKTIRAGGLK